MGFGILSLVPCIPSKTLLFCVFPGCPEGSTFFNHALDNGNDLFSVRIIEP